MSVLHPRQFLGSGSRVDRDAPPSATSPPPMPRDLSLHPLERLSELPARALGIQFSPNHHWPLSRFVATVSDSSMVNLNYFGRGGGGGGGGGGNRRPDGGVGTLGPGVETGPVLRGEVELDRGGGGGGGG